MTNKMNLTRNIALGLCIMGISFSCSSDDDNPVPIHDHEGIEELVIQQTASDGSTQSYTFVAGNENGETIEMTAGETYDFEIIELNAHEENGEEHNILSDVVDAIDEHFFLYEKTIDADFSLTRTDDATTTNADGVKIGITVEVAANTASSGLLTISLKHQSTTVSDSANNGFGSANGGATDVLARFPVTIN